MKSDPVNEAKLIHNRICLSKIIMALISEL